jgi:hypothetical protein
MSRSLGAAFLRTECRVGARDVDPFCGFARMRDEEQRADPCNIYVCDQLATVEAEFASIIDN